MDEQVRQLFADRDSPDRNRAYEALCRLFELAGEPVEWAYDVWDDLVDELTHRDGHKRAFAAQMLAHLAISDPDARMLEDLPKVAAVMEDEKTVTARHTLQSLWRIGLAGSKQRNLVVEALERRYQESQKGKKGRIVRRDVVTALGRLAAETGDASIEPRTRALIETELDDKERTKQDTAWRKATR